jgi:hypothetical protein
VALVSPQSSRVEHEPTGERLGQRRSPVPLQARLCCVNCS